MWNNQTECLAKNARTRLAMSSFLSSRAEMPGVEQVDFGIRQIVLERASDDNWQVREQLSCAHRAARVLPLSKSIRRRGTRCRISV
jgi:hypothetical protein